MGIFGPSTLIQTATQKGMIKFDQTANDNRFTGKLEMGISERSTDCNFFQIRKDANKD